MSYNSFRNDNNGPGEFALIQFRKSNNFASVAALDLLGQVLWSGYDTVTSTYKSASYIYCQATGAPAGNVPSELQFNTSFGTGTQLAMTIGQNGQVTINNPNIDQATLFLNNNQTSPNLNLRTANGTAVNSPHIHFTRSRAGTADVLAADDLGRLEFRGYQGGVAIEAATIRSQAETVNGASVSGNFQFLTRPTSYAALATRMNISANGAVTIPATVAGNVPLTITATNIGGLGVNQANSGAVSISLTQSSADVQPNYINIFKNRAGGNINAGDVISQMQFLGFATASQLAASSRCYAESIGAARVSGAFDWFTTSTAGVSGQRLYLGSNGNVVINTPPAAVSALTVNGFATAGTYAQQNNAYVTSGLFSAFRALNVDGTAGGSCQIEVSVFGQLAATGGDAYLRFVNYGVQGLSLGLDTSVNQFSMSTGNLGDASTFFTYDVATTQINKPRQCAFLAYIGADVPDCTGNGIFYTLGTPTVAAPATPRLFTEVYDQSNNFNTNGTFTAPKSGRYHFAAAIRVFGTGGLATAYQIRFNTTGGLIIGGQGVPSLGNGYFTATCSAYINMTTADTCTLQIQLSGMAGDTADINGDISVTYFGGTLVC